MRKTVLLAVVALAQLVAAHPAAAAEVIVPPGNSGAAQYTEAFPTAAGERDAQHKEKRSPQKVLGKKESKQLQGKGADGKAVAKIVAETSPAPDAGGAAGSGTAAGAAGRSGGESGAGGAGGGEGEAKGGGGGAAPGNGGGNGGSGASGGGSGGGGASAQPRSVAQPAGSSGVGEVVGQATGASSGKLGLLLPLILLGAPVWAILWAWRRRQAQRVV